MLKTSEIESLAEKVVQLSKERNDFYSYYDFEKDFPDNKEYVKVVITLLINNKILKLRVTGKYELSKKKFTTFKSFRRNQFIIDFPKNYWWVLIILSAIIIPIILKHIPEVKKTETNLKPSNIPTSVGKQLNHKNDSPQIQTR